MCETRKLKTIKVFIPPKLFYNCNIFQTGVEIEATRKALLKNHMLAITTDQTSGTVQHCVRKEIKQQEEKGKSYRSKTQTELREGDAIQQD